MNQTSLTPQEGFFARKYKGFQIFPHWCLWGLLSIVGLMVIYVKYEGDITFFLCFGISSLIIFWWLLNLGWRALGTLFS
jgi:hypothetical protein